MKCLIAVFILSLSTAAFAHQDLLPYHGYIEEIHDINCVPENVDSCNDNDEASHLTLSITYFNVVSRLDNNYTLEKSSGTHWQAGAQLMEDVSAIELAYKGSSSVATIYQIDGNYMGTIKTKIDMSCEKLPHGILCQALLPNKNRLALGIGL